MKATKIVELVIADDSEELAIDAISLVTSPAIEQDFVFFGKDKNNLTFAKVDEEKRMLISPALIPNKQIFRHDPNTDSDYYVFFSKETVQKASELYLKHNNHHKATYQHQDRVSGVLTVESWIIEDSKLDKSTLYGFSLPVGTWMVKMHITNEEMWQKVTSGELKGLSIEGYFTNKFEQMNKKKEFTNEEVRNAIKELLSVQKVEFTAIDDMRKRIDNGRKEIKLADKVIEQINNLEKKIKNKRSSIIELSNKLNQDIKGVEKQAKELGINYLDVPEVKESIKLSNKLAETLKELTFQK